MLISSLGVAYFDAGDFQIALDKYGQAIALDSTISEIYINRGLAYGEAGRAREAQSDFTRALRLNPNQAAAYTSRAWSYMKSGEWDRAIADYDEAAKLEPLDAGHQTARCWTRVQAGRELDVARAACDEALRLKPNYAAAYRARAELHKKSGDWDRAIADYDEAAKLEPLNVNFQNGRCWVRAIAGRDLDVARAACDEALRFSPAFGDAFDSRGAVGLKQSRFQQAWNDYDSAVKIDTSNAGYLFGRGVAALRLGRTQGGQADIAAAIKIDPKVVTTYAGYGIKP